jgi:hypothetical protein
MNTPGSPVQVRPPAARRRRWLATAAGAALALALFEAGLRQLSRNPPDRVPVAQDTPREPVHERRLYHEGIATAHFSPAHARLTGGEWIDGAPVGVIVGDSHVVAAQVADHETMGAVAERGLRRMGTPVNLRQYGRAGSSAPHMLAEAAEIMRRWNPAWVVVVVADGDLDRNALVGSPRLEIRPDTSWTLRVDPPAPPLPGLRGLVRRTYLAAVRTSALAYMTSLRGGRLINGPPTHHPPLRPTDPGYEVRRLVPLVTVRALRQAFGDRLHVIYLSYAGVTAAEDVRYFEAPLLEACRAERVRCTSMHPAFTVARDRDHRLARGFANTPPVWGHLNAEGHRLVGEAILHAVAR